MPENWKKPEEDNMSIGELAEWLSKLPKELHHLPVTISWDNQVFRINTKRFFFTDGERYYSDKVLEQMRAYPGISLEIDANPNL
jgi:hypothetical protein